MYAKKSLMECFEAWDKQLNERKLPLWDELPSLELYMDQVLVLLNRYTDIFSISKRGAVISAPMVNNYVKQKTVPAPVGKKYQKKHLAYLIVVCTLKQALSISTIQKLMPVTLTDEEVKAMYNAFAHNQQKAFSYVAKQVTAVSIPLLTKEGDNPERVQDLMFQVAVSANIFKTLSEELSDIPKEN